MSKQRPLSGEEKAILERLFEKNFPERDRLREQAVGSFVEEWDDGSRTLSFVAGHNTPAAHWVAVEAEYDDADGVTAHVLLHVRDGHVFELEFFREAPGPVLKRPAPDELRFL